MSFRRYCGGRLSLAALTLCALAVPGLAAALTLDEALRLAEREAPSLAAQAANQDAAMQAAIPAGELPDPKLALGIQNFPIEGDARGSLTRDFMTMQMVGVMQEVPNRAKRRARVEAAQAGIDSADALERVERLKVRRETALAWIGGFAVEQKLQLFQTLYDENRLLAKAVQANLAGGRGQAADSLAPKQEAALLAEQEDELERNRTQARAALRRWVGPVAVEPLSGSWPSWRVDDLHFRHSLDRHPELQAFTPMTQEAEAQVRLAEADKKPDWSWELAYQKRGEAFGDMVSVQFTFDLPLFTASRQDPKIAAKRAEVLRLEAEREAMTREHAQALADDLAEHRRLERAVERSRQTLVPLAEEKVRLAMADYRAGRGELMALVAARRELIEARLKHIDLEQQRAQTSARLYFAYGESSQ
ncbi:TolC family protein [Pseudomonas aeruginosa]|jgi:outer membrane protein TolC|uniref:TolC family protein n=1 Tax=Pseudomonas TaxID=286 RepID=UPI0005CD7F43|nr:MULTISPECIES: TolC family protein [Pseudomonas]EIU4991399.1 TolC family protein [Pseudomonas aeruginosa]EIY2608115.1 TolC family protein [Pseudomonas aeruginosa]EIY2740536.1 TolC family protein [Pseudomonas aeruginosa]EKM0199686.1 TolC family protein [Pseudomonas aeruginosa]EKM0219893.1 TolC family protein [Pseudomonas aeruginosa]